jgi:hypothetical protein
MKKGKFLVKYNTAVNLSQKFYNKLGLKAKSFTNTQLSVYEELADEEYYLMAELAEKKEDNSLKKDANQQLILTAENQKLLHLKLKSWKNEEVELNEFKPFIPELPKDNHLFLISPEIFETLNGFVFQLEEEDYLNILGQIKE